MNIVFCIDKNYETMARVSIASYRKFNPDAKITIVAEYNVPRIGQNETKVINLTREFRKRSNKDRISNAAYLKLFLTELNYRKIIYVDADTLCQKPLDDLWNLPCPYINLCESHAFGEQQAKSLGLKRYGLTGMMVMNLDSLRRYGFTERCLTVEDSSDIPTNMWFHDETCINVAMSNLLTFVDKKFNYCHKRIYKQPIPEDDAYILHYVGKDKSDIYRNSKYGEIAEIGSFIDGKSVAIVGNAKSLFGKKQGEEIDNHDFIIRFNKGFLYKPVDQGHKTNLLILACLITPEEIEGFNPQFVINRSSSWKNKGLTLANTERMIMKELIGKQPSSGYIAIDICLHFNAKHIDLYGFDFGATPTFYNAPNYKVPHDYDKEKELLQQYIKKEKIKVH